MVYIEREAEEKIKKWLSDKEIIILRGPRQSGKTTLLKRTKEILIDKGISDNSIKYFSFEDDFLRIKFEENCQEFIKSHLDKENFEKPQNSQDSSLKIHEKMNYSKGYKEKTYFLLDEIQYVRDIGKKLKLLFDIFENSKFIVSGSSSFDLTNLGKYLVGRVIFIEIYPFSFHEFLKTKGERYENLYLEYKLDIKNPKIKKGLFIDELNELLKEYLTYGSYPRIILENDKEKKKELLKNLFMTYIEKDIVSLYGNKYRDSVIKLLKLLSSSKSIIKYESLSSDLNLKYNKIKEIIPLLEDSYALFIVKPFFKNLSNELKKNPKIYFVDYGIRNYISETIDNPDFDILYENFINNMFKNEHKVKYWRTTAKTEVDFIIDESIPIEVKTVPKISRALRGFIQKYKPKIAFIANLKSSEKKKIDDCEVFIAPFVYF